MSDEHDAHDQDGSVDVDAHDDDTREDHGGHDDDHGAPEHGVESRPAYDPADKNLPPREPPLRGTAPQSPYTSRDVAVGFAVLLVGLALTFGLSLGVVGI